MNTQPHSVLCMGCMANYAMMDSFKDYSLETSTIRTIRTGKSLPPFYIVGLLKKAKRIIVNAEWWRDELSSKGYDCRKIHVIHNALLTSRNKNQASD